MLIIAHMSLMIIAALCLFTGVSMAMFFRKKKTWLKLHKALNIAGVCLMLAGASMAFANVVTSDEHHLAGLHQWIGLTAIILCGLTLFLGFYSFKATNKAAVRTAHRWSGRLSLLGILAALIAVLKMIGVF